MFCFFFFFGSGHYVLGIMEKDFFLSKYVFVQNSSPCPKPYSEINLMALCATGMFLVSVCGVLPSLGLEMSKEKLANNCGHYPPPGRCIVQSVARCPGFPRKVSVFSTLFREPMAHSHLWHVKFSESHATWYIKCDALYPPCYKDDVRGFIDMPTLLGILVREL